MRCVIVLDMDNTLGVRLGGSFYPRPFAACFVRSLAFSGMDIVLWSMGTDDYVITTVNSTLLFIKRHAKYIFGRTVCMQSMEAFGFYKASQMIRDLYPEEEEDLYLIGVDDCANSVFDNNYNLRFQVEKYLREDESDVELMKVLDTIFRGFDPDVPLT